MMKNTKKAVLLLTFVCGLFSHAAAFAVQQGCFNASEGDVRAFSFLAGASDTMTIETCRKLAVNRFVGSFGLEKGRECRLDPLNSGSTQLTRLGASEGCDVPCSGDTRIICGGQQAASIYTEVDATPAAVPPNDDYAAVGCYKDDTAVRRLTLLWVANNSMSVDLCASIAYSEQWLVFGVEGGSECWAGQAEDTAKSLGTSTACTTPCPGNNSQTCGGDLALNLFARKTAPWLEVTPVTTDDTSGPSLIVGGSSCVGAAASSAACRGVPESAGGQVTASKIVTGLAVAAAAAVLWL